MAAGRAQGQVNVLVNPVINQAAWNRVARSFPLGRITGDISQFQQSLDAAAARTSAFAVSAGSLAGTATLIKNIAKSFIDVEDALININSVFGLSQRDLGQFGKQLFTVARNTASSFEDAAASAQEFARQGLSVIETSKRVEAALTLVKISGIGVEEATQSLTAALNGFSKEGLNAIDIVDKLASVDAAFAVSTADLAAGLSRVGDTAQSAGVDLDSLLASVAAIQQRTARGGAVIGNGLKSIFTRLQRSGVQDTLNQIGVQTQDANGSFRSAIDVLQDYAAVYSTLTDAQKAYSSEQIAGLYQINTLKALVADLNSETSAFARAQDIAAESSGSSRRRLDELTQSTKALSMQTLASLKEVGAATGKDLFGPIINKLLGNVKSGSEILSGLLDPENTTKQARILQKVVEDLGNFIAGPGFIGAAFVLGKLFIRMARDVGGAIRSAATMGTFLDKNRQIQSQINGLVQNDIGLQQRLLGLTGNRVAQEAELLNYMRQRVALEGQVSAINSGVVPRVAKNFKLVGRGPNARVASKAGGHINTSSEQAMINQGVGGARPGDYPKVMRGFDFGGGKKGTVVANTGEWLVPNFGGGDAIFNRDMVREYGLPKGAKRISGAAGGYVPNFAKIKYLKKSPSQEWRRYRIPETGSTLDFDKSEDQDDTISIGFMSSKRKGDARELFGKIAKLAKRTNKSLYSHELVPQYNDFTRGGINELNLLKAYPQLRYRQGISKRTTGTVSYYDANNDEYIDDNFGSVDELKKIVEDVRGGFTIHDVYDYFARGYIPNFANPKSVKYNSKSRIAKTDAGSYLTYGLNGGQIDLKYINSLQKGDGFKLFSNLANVSKRAKKPIFSKYLDLQEGYDKPLTANSRNLLKAFPQLRYRMGRGSHRGTMVAGGDRMDFNSIEDILSYVSKNNVKLNDLEFRDIISSYAGGYVPNFAQNTTRLYRGVKSGLTQVKPELRYFSDNIDPNGIFNMLSLRQIEELQDKRKNIGKEFLSEKEQEILSKNKKLAQRITERKFIKYGILSSLGRHAGGMSLGLNRRAYMGPFLPFVSTSKNKAVAESFSGYSGHEASLAEIDFPTNRIITDAKYRKLKDFIVKKSGLPYRQHPDADPIVNRILLNSSKFKGGRGIGFDLNSFRAAPYAGEEEVALLADGYVPNFANPLSAAIAREASVRPKSSIRINQSPSLASGTNPLGLAVTNTIDEPRGLADVPNRGKGYVPNFAKAGQKFSRGGGEAEILDASGKEYLIRWPSGKESYAPKKLIDEKIGARIPPRSEKSPESAILGKDTQNKMRQAARAKVENAATTSKDSKKAAESTKKIVEKKEEVAKIEAPVVKEEKKVAEVKKKTVKVEKKTAAKASKNAKAAARRVTDKQAVNIAFAGVSNAGVGLAETFEESKSRQARRARYEKEKQAEKNYQEYQAAKTAKKVAQANKQYRQGGKFAKEIVDGEFVGKEPFFAPSLIARKSKNYEVSAIEQKALPYTPGENARLTEDFVKQQQKDFDARISAERAARATPSQPARNLLGNKPAELRAAAISKAAFVGLTNSTNAGNRLFEEFAEEKLAKAEYEDAKKFRDAKMSLGPANGPQFYSGSKTLEQRKAAFKPIYDTGGVSNFSSSYRGGGGRAGSRFGGGGGGGGPPPIPPRKIVGAGKGFKANNNALPTRPRKDFSNVGFALASAAFLLPSVIGGLSGESQEDTSELTDYREIQKINARQDKSSKQTSALQTGVIGAQIGGSIGAVGGPLGAVIGAVAGGIGGAATGWLTAITSTEKGLEEITAKQIAYQNSLQKTSSSIGAVESLLGSKNKLTESLKGGNAKAIANAQREFLDTATQLSATLDPELYAKVLASDGQEDLTKTLRQEQSSTGAKALIAGILKKGELSSKTSQQDLSSAITLSRINREGKALGAVEIDDVFDKGSFSGKKTSISSALNKFSTSIVPETKGALVQGYDPGFFGKGRVKTSFIEGEKAKVDVKTLDTKELLDFAYELEANAPQFADLAKQIREQTYNIKEEAAQIKLAELLQVFNKQVEKEKQDVETQEKAKKLIQEKAKRQKIEDTSVANFLDASQARLSAGQLKTNYLTSAATLASRGEGYGILPPGSSDKASNALLEQSALQGMRASIEQAMKGLLEKTSGVEGLGDFTKRLSAIGSRTPTTIAESDAQLNEIAALVAETQKTEKGVGDVATEIGKLVSEAKNTNSSIQADVQLQKQTEAALKKQSIAGERAVYSRELRRDDFEGIRTQGAKAAAGAMLPQELRDYITDLSKNVYTSEETRFAIGEKQRKSNIASEINATLGFGPDDNRVRSDKEYNEAFRKQFGGSNKILASVQKERLRNMIGELRGSKKVEDSPTSLPQIQGLEESKKLIEEKEKAAKEMTEALKTAAKAMEEANEKNKKDQEAFQENVIKIIEFAQSWIQEMTGKPINLTGPITATGPVNSTKDSNKEPAKPGGRP